MRTRSFLGTLVAAALGVVGMGVTSPAAPSAAASTPTTSRAPVHEVVVDPGALATASSWTIEVEKGDTFSEIALRSLGSARRAGEIQRLNPRVDAKSLRVGQTLVLPPRKTPTGSAWMDLVVASPGGTARTVGLGEAATLPLGPVRLFAVPHERLLLLRAAARGPEVTEAALRDDAEVAASPLIEVAAEGRTLARATTRLKVTGRNGRSLGVEIVEQNLYGASGHRVRPASEDDAGGGWAVPLLLVLAGLVVFGLVALAARRMAVADESGTRAP